MNPLLVALGAAGAVAYPFLEAKWFRLKQIPVRFSHDVPKLRILHLSDTHLTESDERLTRFIHSLPELIGKPDVVVATGDLLEDDIGIEPITSALSSIDAHIGRFYVLGSHDYYQAQFESYFKYFARQARPTRAPRANTDELERRLQDAGWICLTNRSHVVETPHGPMRFGGVDDPYLKRQDVHHIERSAEEVLAIGLAHSPDVVSEWMLRGFDLVFAGHTHAGQVRFPLLGALVTNSMLPTTLAGGLHAVGNSYLHVSPGLGTGRYAPIRFNCRPEATLLTLT